MTAFTRGWLVPTLPRGNAYHVAYMFDFPDASCPGMGYHGEPWEPGNDEFDHN